MEPESEFRLTPPGPVKHPATSYVEENLEDLWDASKGEMGVWVRYFDVQGTINVADVDLLEGKVSAKRLAALGKGATPEQAEVDLWKHAWVDRAFGDSDNADEIPGYLITEITNASEAPAFALILCTGYSFTELEHSCEGIFESVEAAKEYMRGSGWIS